MANRSVSDVLIGWLRRRAERDPNRIIVTIAPLQAAKVHQVEIPRRMVRVGFGILLLVILVLVVGGVYFGIVVRDAYLLGAVQKENAVLRERVGRVAQLEEELDRLDEFRQQLYDLAGVTGGEGGNTLSDSGGALARATGVQYVPKRAELSEAGLRSPLRVVPLWGPLSRGFTVGEGHKVEHAGVDVAGSEGLPIAAAADGRVTFAGWDTTFGFLLVLRHRSGWETKYGHAQQLLVSEGDSVRAGQTVALLGSTGQSSAPHLHFEVLWEGKVVDPADYFKTYRAAVTDEREAARR
jgi:murein DD-endopeptidase MepM/ murein hydrolase activator NlpD